MGRPFRFACVVAGLAVAAALPVLAQRDAPTAHMTVASPARLDGVRAEAVYQAIRGAMAAHYGESGDPVTAEYQLWRRLNAAPYRSSAHGARFVNNYANALAAPAYAAQGMEGPVPEGGIVVKDSFVVTEGGEVLTGPLYLMEKRATGFSPETGDWLFMEIDRQGEVLGISGGPGADRVGFCAACHVKPGRARDGLYYMPEAVRVR